MDDRVRPLAGIHNLRDYGGYAARDGRLCTGLLWRSGQHGAATDADLAAIDALRIATVIDLRGDGERMRWPCRRSAGFAGRVLFAEGETAGAGGAAHAVAARAVVTEADAHAAMIDLYAFMPLRPNLQRAFRHYFEALAAGAAPSLVHCFAGKDRTGLAVALLHRMLGVHHDDIVADYLLTNTAGDSAARIAAGAESLRRSRPDASEAAIVALMSVDARYLDAAFTTIDDKWGGVDAYADAMLGVDTARREQLAALLIA